MLEITQKPLFKVERCGVERESMEFDVVVVGAGPAGLSAAIRLMQLAESAGRETTVCVVEKGSEVGAHILSGAVLEPRALNELIPDWQERGAPLNAPVTGDTFYFYTGERSAIKLPGFVIPRPTHNDGNYIVSMGNVCRWLAEQAELSLRLAEGGKLQPGSRVQHGAGHQHALHVRGAPPHGLACCVLGACARSW